MWAYSSYSHQYRRKIPSTPLTGGPGAAALPALAPGVELAHAGDGGRVSAATADVHNVFAAQRLNNPGPIHGVFVVMAQFTVVACDTKEDYVLKKTTAAGPSTGYSLLIEYRKG